MNEDNPFVCVIDDESSIRESLSNLLRSAGLKVQAFCLGTRVFGQPASRSSQLPGARYTTTGNKWS